MRTRKRNIVVVYVWLILSLSGCIQEVDDGDNLFEKMSLESIGINFRNALVPTEEINTYVFRNFYNGGGVAIGDINNDGMPDIFFTGNQVSNRLYLNTGSFTFQDITLEAGLPSDGAWSTGVSMADVNGDGWLDIYICKSGPPGGERRRNELYINNGDTTFTEQAREYGLDVLGLSIHASFFDFDRDGDLDMYLLSNPIESLDNLVPLEGLREIYVDHGGNKLYRNDLLPAGDQGSDENRNTHSSPANTGFTDVTREAGLYSSKIGFGLGVSVADVNRDGWPDIYVSNDFFERDYLYLNNGDGTFSEMLTQIMKEISLSSMGGDIVDLNNDGYPEIFVSDMLPKSRHRVSAKISFPTWIEYNETTEAGYHYQVPRNTLQLNRGTQAPSAYLSGKKIGGAAPVTFSEIGRIAGVEASDWSWGGLIADFDLDGHRDLFIPNGIYKDLLDQDYLERISDPDTFRFIIKNEAEPILKIVESMPSTPISNHMFAGRSDLQFTDVSASWGLSEPSFSNGSAYGDLDNDGDLDLVVNNVNMDAFVYRNRATELHPERAWLQVRLEGASPNPFTVGAQVTAFSGDRLWYVEQQPVRGFQSTVDHVLHLGFGSRLSHERLDSLVIRWPDGTVDRLNDVEINRRLTLRHAEASSPPVRTSSSK